VFSIVNFQGIIFTYNLSYAFTPDTNVSGLLLQDPLSKALGGVGQSNGNTPNYVDGALLANDDEFFFFGGLPNVVFGPPPAKDSLLDYQAFHYGPASPNFETGFQGQNKLPSDVSQYVTFGGAANAPSENLAWYFSGMTSGSGGPLNYLFNDTTRPSKISNYLVTVDMALQNFETWTNKSLPNPVKGRASPELVWVPVGAKGILVALGGVVFPEYANVSRHSQNPQASVWNAPDLPSILVHYSNNKHLGITKPSLYAHY
jgi:hypothetical protein